MDKSKKIIIVVAIVMFLIATGVGVYFGLKESSTVIRSGNVPPDSSDNLPVGGEDISSNKDYKYTPLPINRGEEDKNVQDESGSEITVRRISTDLSVDFWMVYSTSTSKYGVIYIKDSGELVYSPFDGDESEITSTPENKKPIKVVSNKDGSITAVKFNDGSWSLFYVEDSAWESLEKGISSVSFSPEGDSIAYVLEKDDGEDIILYNLEPSNKEKVLLLSLGTFDMNILWDESNSLLLVSSPSFYSESNVIKIDIKKGTLSSIYKGEGVIVKMFGELGILFDVKDDKAESSVIDTDFSIKSVLSQLVFPNECNDWEDSIICTDASLGTRQQNYNLPDDYLSNYISSRDKIFKINKNDFSTEDIFDGGNYNIDISKMFAVDKNNIVFRNKIDGGIYQLKTISKDEEEDIPTEE